MNYQLLKDEIGRLGLTGSDDEIANLLNAPTLTSIQSRFVNANTILAEIDGGSGILDKLEMASQLSSDVKWAMKFLLTDSGIDIGHPRTQAQLSLLADAGLLAADESSSLQNMAMRPISQAELSGLGVVSYNDVNTARAI